MPERPDIDAYLSALDERIVESTLEGVRIGSPFVLRTALPPIARAEGQTVTQLRRIGKRVAIGFADGLWIVIHLMIAGRLHWRARGAPLGGRNNLAAFDFAQGSLLLTEAGTKRRASLHVVEGEAGLTAMDPGGVDPLTSTSAEFQQALLKENRTLKRALTDPRILSGIGNAYSDEILHEARLSPITLTRKLNEGEWARLYEATLSILREWIERLCKESEHAFPEKVTAFRPEMSVHGRFGKLCPRCGDPIQRIRYADNETNYCPGCQTQGKLLADRSLSKLLGKDWPRSLDELEALRKK